MLSSAQRQERKEDLLSYSFKEIQLNCDRINSSIINAFTLLSLIVSLITIDFTCNSPQEAGAGHSDFVAPTWVTTKIQLINFRCPFHLTITLHPSSLTPQLAEIFWIISIETLFTRNQPPLLKCRQPLSPILFYPELRSNDIGKSHPALPRQPSRGACSPFSPIRCPLYIHKSTQSNCLEPPPLGSAEELAAGVPHLVLTYFSTKVLSSMASRLLISAWLR